MKSDLPQDYDLGCGLPILPAAPDELAVTSALEVTEPAVDVAFILAIASSGIADGSDQVELHHRNLWTSVNGAGLTRLSSHRRRFLERLKLMLLQFREGLEALRRIPELLKQPEWSTWDWVKFLSAIFGLLVLVGASVFTVFTLLRNTAVFEQMPVAAFLTAALVAAIPVAGKLGIDVIRSEVALNRLRFFLGWGALGLFCVWAVLLARLTGGLGAGVQDPLALTAPTTSEGPATGWGLSTHLQYLQLMVETLGGLACFSYADLLYQRSRPGKPIINSLYLAYSRRVSQAERALAADHYQLGEGKGRLLQLRAHREVFVGRARARYLSVLQSKVRRDQLRLEYSRVQSALDSLEGELSGQRMN